MRVEEMPDKRIGRIARIVLWVVPVLLGVGLAAKVASALPVHAALFDHPFQFDESEGMIVAETLLLDRGVPIFDVPGPELFIAAPYPPVFYLFCWPVQHLLGDEPSFKIGRTISILATLLAGVSIMGIVYSLTRNRWAGGLAGLAFWSLGLVTFWGTLVKPDMLALALGLAGVWWAVARPHGQVWWALIPLLLAFYTKQTGIASAGAVAGWLVLTRPRLGLGFGAAYAAGAVVPSVLLDWATRGGYFYHQFTLHSLPWFPDRFVGFLQSLATDYGAILIPGALAALVVGAAWVPSRFLGWRDALPRGGGLLVAIYLLMSLAVSSGTGTLGGNHNHMLDLVAACCIGVGVWAAWALETGASLSKRLAGIALGALAIAWVPSLFSVPVWLQLEFNQLKADRTAGLMNIFQYVTNDPGEAYSDNVGLMVATRKKLWSTDPYTQTHASFYGRWDQGRLVQAIRSRQFSQIVLRVEVDAPDAGAGDVSPEILQAVRDNYKLDQRNVLNIYVPK